MPLRTYVYQDEALRRSYARGMSSTITLLLSVREVKITPAEAARIDACEDLAEIERMIHKAVTVQSAAELFE